MTFWQHITNCPDCDAPLSIVHNTEHRGDFYCPECDEYTDNASMVRRVKREIKRARDIAWIERRSRNAVAGAVGSYERKKMTKTQEIQYLGQMLTATTGSDVGRLAAVVKRLQEIKENPDGQT